MPDIEARLRQMENLVNGLKWAVPTVATVVVAAAAFFGVSLSEVKTEAAAAKKSAGEASTKAAEAHTTADDAAKKALTAAKTSGEATTKVDQATEDAKARLEAMVPKLSEDLKGHADLEQKRLAEALRAVAQEQRQKFKFINSGDVTVDNSKGGPATAPPTALPVSRDGGVCMLSRVDITDQGPSRNDHSFCMVDRTAKGWQLRVHASGGARIICRAACLRWDEP